MKLRGKPMQMNLAAIAGVRSNYVVHTQSVPEFYVCSISFE